MTIGSLAADASSTDGFAKASAGADDNAVGAVLPSLTVGGIGNITGAAQLDSSADALSVSSSSQAFAGLRQTVTGLNASDIDVASDASLTAQGFSNLDASATSTEKFARAQAGDGSSMVTGLASGLDLDIGGIGTLAVTAQGTADAAATSVDESARAFASQQSVGIASGLNMDTASDAMVSSTSTIVGGADAASTSGTTSVAEMNFAALGSSGIDLEAGGIGTLSTGANVTGDSSATGVGSDSSSSGNLTALGLGSTTFDSASDGTVSATGFIDGGVSASSTDCASISSGVFNAIGVGGLQNMAVGGVLDLTGQAQASGDVSAESVDSTACHLHPGLPGIYGIKGALPDGAAMAPFSAQHSVTSQPPLSQRVMTLSLVARKASLAYKP